MPEVGHHEVMSYRPYPDANRSLRHVRRQRVATYEMTPLQRSAQQALENAARHLAPIFEQIKADASRIAL